jgi:hypothetical protein
MISHASLRYRVIAKSGGVIVHDERSNSLRVVNETVRALLNEGGNAVTVFDNGRPFTVSHEPTGLGAEVDALLDDFFALAAAVSH